MMEFLQIMCATAGGTLLGSLSSFYIFRIFIRRHLMNDVVKAIRETMKDYGCRCRKKKVSDLGENDCAFESILGKGRYITSDVPGRFVSKSCIIRTRPTSVGATDIINDLNDDRGSYEDVDPVRSSRHK